MLILLLVLATFQRYGTSAPIIPNVIDVREVLQSGPPITEGHKIRTTFDIVWSCVSTLFICTWVAIHPNISPCEGPIRALWRKIKLMIWTLLVPELILIWAFRQWDAAKYIAAYFEDEGWTRAHAHFLIMGGFRYIDEGGEKVVTFDEFCRLLGLHDNTPPLVAFPTITADEIRDKARGDFLSKSIVILQSLWFIIQCVARGTQGLALTELELVTLALASLNGVMYFFWWDKPLGVNEPVKLYREGYEPTKKFIAGGRAENDKRVQRIMNPPQHRLVEVLAAVLLSMVAWFKASYKSFISLISSIYQRLSSMNFNVKEFVDDQRFKLDGDIPFVDLLWFIYLPIYWLIWIPVRELAYALLAFFNNDEVEAGASHVPSLYSPDTPSTSSGYLTSFLLAIPTIFGGLHVIGWSFQFPSRMEQLLWRGGSLVITVIPASPIFILAFALINFAIDRLFNFPDIIAGLISAVAIFILGVSLVAYMAARILLLVLALVLLRRQPESAYYAINWTHFFPHI